MEYITFFLVILLSESSRAVIDKPNIITILIDDLGWNDVGFHGSDQISTPNIDALAYSGVILNRHYVLPTCTPSRAALLTGAYPVRTGMQGYPMKCGTRRGIPLSVKLKPDYLKNLGYHTHLVGKWHLGYPSHEYLPNRRGFDTFFGYYNGYISYYDYEVSQEFALNNISYAYTGYDLHREEHADWKWKGKYATSVFTNRAKKIIQNHNRTEPLYLYLSHLGVHTGTTDGTGLELPEDVDVDKEYPHIKHRPRREFAGVLKEIDKSVGAVVKALKKNNMLDNSIILIMSDNGAQTVCHDMQPNWGSNWPLRGMKFTLFEGGVRGAALIWSPLLPKGVVSQQFIHITDWLPTLYYAAGGNVSDLVDIDGVNVWNSLRESTTMKRGHILLNLDEAYNDEGIIINNRWKVRKGGIRNYAFYDFHWGKEENVGPLPNDYLSKIRKSPVGRVLRNITDYKDVLTSRKVEISRNKSRVECSFESDVDHIETKDNYVSGSTDFYCQDYCVFDLIKDPCELTKVDNKKVLKKGMNLLNKYRRSLFPGGDNSVDPLSDPKKWGGVWMPWLSLNKLFYV